MRVKQSMLVWVIAVLLLSVSSLDISAQGQRDRGRDNCPVTSDQILGQAFGSTAGAEGETGADGLTPEGEDIEASGLALDAVWIMEMLPYSDIGPERVAILVLDDFSSEPDAEELSHGWLVYEVFEALFDHLPQAAANLLTLVPVNIADQAGFSADLIVPRLRETLTELTQAGFERYVLNMSFVFIPCEDRSLGFDFNDFRESRARRPDLSLVEQVGGNRDYVLSILNDSRVAQIESNRLNTNVEARLAPQAEARAQIERPTPPDTRPTPQQRDDVPGFQARELAVLRLFDNRQLERDPLRDFLTDPPHLIVPVAAAGNFKQSVPFYPARWPEVISVSADEGNDLRFWLNSNNGEVTVPGAWHRFSDDVYRAGTSFAAPVLSTLIALDLTQATPICGKDGNQPDLAHETFDNVLLRQAVADFCSP